MWMYLKEILSVGRIHRKWHNPFIKRMEKVFMDLPFKRLQITRRVTLVEHGGGQPGVSSNFGFIPEKGIVAVVLTNMGGVSADAIWLAAMNTALGIPIDQKRSIEPQFEMTKEQQQRVLGTYISAEGSQVDISLEDQTVMATIDNKTYALRASDETTLVIMPLEKPIRFFIDEKNDAWALFIGLRMLVKSRK